eukprot:scaffold333841_cov15-Prasinocladus_malaysianus.AAC.2
MLHAARVPAGSTSFARACLLRDAKETLKDCTCKTTVCERAGPANVCLAGRLEVHCQVSPLKECLATAEL